MGAYVIATNNSKSRDELIIMDEKNWQPYGKYKGESYHGLAGGSLEEQAQSLLNKIQEKEPNTKLTLSEDAASWGVLPTSEYFEQKFTIFPRDYKGMKDGMLDGDIYLPVIGSQIAHGKESVSFPIYQSDPSDFLPDHLEAIPLVIVKKLVNRETIAWGAPGELKENFLPENINNLDVDKRAALIVDFMRTYKNKSALPDIVNKAVLDTVKHPDDDMSKQNFIMSLAGYIGHYAGDELSEVYVKSMVGDVDESDIRYGRAQAIAAQGEASNSFKQQDKMIHSILQQQNENNLSPEQSLAELGITIYHLGLDSETVHAFAHRSGSSFPQFNSPSDPKVSQESAPEFRRK